MELLAQLQLAIDTNKITLQANENLTKRKVMSIKVISHTTKKLIIQSPNISENILPLADLICSFLHSELPQMIKVPP